VPGIERRPPLPTLEVMAAAGHLLESPPLTSPAAPATLVALPGGGVEPRLAEAEHLVEVNHHADAVELLDELWPEVRHEPALALRHRLAHAWACLYLGDLDTAAELVEQAENLACLPRFDAAARAEVMCHKGCLALNRSDAAEATSLFTRALETNERAPVPSARLAARIHEWRSRSHQLQRSLDAARRDADRSLELALRLGDEHAEAHALVQASLVAERQRQWLLARFYAEQALELCRRHGDVLATARILNNLGGILFLLGETQEAERRLEEAAQTAAEAGSDADVAQAISSLAQVYERSDRPAEAVERARAAAELLAGREDFLDELGNVQLVAARALAAQGQPDAAHTWLDGAEASFTRFGSTSHLAAVYVARGDLARAAGDLSAAAALYRRAAESLQDVHF
jgi:tetratricopeptide (TPR) repeat protein